MAAIGFVLHHERAQAADLAREAADVAAWPRATRCGSRSPTPTSPGSATLGCDEAALADGPRPGREPRRRRHDAAHRRPGRRRRACRSSASTSARWATSPTSSRPARGPRSSGSSPASARIEERMLLTVAVRARRRPSSRAPRLQRGGAREDPDGPHRAPRRGGRRRVLHHLRRRRAHRRHAHRVDRLRLLGPRARSWRPPTGRCCSPRCRPTCCSTAPSCSSPPRGCGSSCRATGPPRSASTAATCGELGEGDSIVCTAADRSARLVTFGPRDFLQILKTKFGLEDR